MSDEVDVGEVFLRKVRLSFWDGFRPKTFKNEDGSESSPRYGANFLLPKDNSAVAKYPGPKGKEMPALVALKKAKLAILKKHDPNFDPKKLKPQYHCVRDGDQETYDGYEDHYYVSSGNTQKPVIVDTVRTRELTEADGRPYSGCYVNAIVRLWVQKPGKNKDGSPRPMRVNASLEAVQFAGDGEQFGRKRVDPNDAFEDLEGDEIGDDDDDGDDDDLV